MHVTTIVIVILGAIVLSNIANRIFPFLPLNLIQIAFGAVLALTVLHEPVELETEIFMVLIIAPLLFREAEEADLMDLWNLKSRVFFMAFILVFITVFAIGFGTHFLAKAAVGIEIPLAACFILGAVLGPTDLVAVANVAKRVRIDRRVLGTLLGEGLINDASGLISFNFAVAALVTGTFSVLLATGRLLLVSVGGIAVGVILTLAKRFVSSWMRRINIENTSAYVLTEILMPFLCYVAAESFGFSGVLAVVAAGTLQVFDLKRGGLFEAELGGTTHTFWDMLKFSLNSIVFILLGLELPSIVTDVWNDAEYDKFFLVFLIVLVTFILFLIRFVSVAIISSADGSGVGGKMKNAALLTFSGVKGAVSLAIAFSIPFVLADGAKFEQRPLLLFITAGVIILTLLIAQISLPILAGKSEVENEDEIAEELVINETMNQIKVHYASVAEAEPDENTKRLILEKAAPLIANYRIRAGQDRGNRREDEKRDLKNLRFLIFETEHGILKKYFEKDDISIQTYQDYLAFLTSIYHLSSRRGMFPQTFITRKMLRRRSKRGGSAASRVESRKHLRELQELFRRNTQIVISELNRVRGKFQDDLIDRMIDERMEMSRRIMESIYGEEYRERLNKTHENELLTAYYIERRVIHELLRDDKITIEQANALRVKVNKLESHALSNPPNEAVLKLTELARIGREK